MATPVFLPEESHGQRSVVGYSSCVRKRIGHNWVTNVFILTTYLNVKGKKINVKGHYLFGWLKYSGIGSVYTKNHSIL